MVGTWRLLHLRGWPVDTGQETDTNGGDYLIGYSKFYCVEDLSRMVQIFERTA